MKKWLAFPIAFIACSCVHFTEQRKVYTQDSVPNSEQTTSSSTATTYQLGSGCKSRGSITNEVNGVACVLQYDFSTEVSPNVDIQMCLNFKKGVFEIKDTLLTPKFSPLMAFNGVKKIQIDSLDFKVVDDGVRMKFLMKLIKSEEPRMVDKYLMVYSSDFAHTNPVFAVDRIEKSMIQQIGHSY